MTTRPTFSGDNAQTTKKPEPGLASSDIFPLKGDQNLELTIEQRAGVISNLFGPTVNRICTLISTVVQTGQNADMALWLPLASMDNCLRDLKWNDAPVDVGLRLLELITSTLRGYADKVNAHMLALAEWDGRGRQGDRPVMPAWQNEDTLRLYDEVEARMPLKSAPPPSDREVCRDLLLLVIDMTGLPGSDVALESASNEDVQKADADLTAVITTWSDEQVEAASTWAGMLHLKASDNNDVVVPPRPDFIPPPAPPPTPTTPEVSQ